MSAARVALVAALAALEQGVAAAREDARRHASTTWAVPPDDADLDRIVATMTDGNGRYLFVDAQAAIVQGLAALANLDAATSR